MTQTEEYVHVSENQVRYNASIYLQIAAVFVHAFMPFEKKTKTKIMPY